jgi:hypothetical protein
MGCQFSQVKLPFKTKWSTPVRPFDQRKVRNGLKRTSISNGRFWKLRKNGEKTFPIKKISPGRKNSKSLCWWMSKSRRVNVSPVTTIKVKPINVEPLKADPIHSAPDEATSRSKTTIKNSRTTTIRPKAARPQKSYPKRDLPFGLNEPPVISNMETTSIDREFEALFAYPDLILQDYDEPDITYGKYNNRCPTRCGVAFDLVFDKEDRPMTAKPVLQNGKTHQVRGRQAKAAMNRKQKEAAKRRMEKHQQTKRKMQEQAALDKFMNSQLAKDKSPNNETTGKRQSVAKSKNNDNKDLSSNKLNGWTLPSETTISPDETPPRVTRIIIKSEHRMSKNNNTIS